MVSVLMGLKAALFKAWPESIDVDQQGQQSSVDPWSVE